MSSYTKAELADMWKRPPERQYMIAQTKITQALIDTDGNMSVAFSGGKDSSLLLDMVAEIWASTKFRNKPLPVYFADTTNETAEMLRFIKFFIPHVEQKYGIRLDFQRLRPAKGRTWASVVRAEGLPLISKEQSHCIRFVQRDLQRLGISPDTVYPLYRKDIDAVCQLKALGFSKAAILAITGWVSSREDFGKKGRISRVWLPMIGAPVPVSDKCCVRIKESSLDKMPSIGIFTGEQAQESKLRERDYLKYGCNARLSNGRYRARPFGPMTEQGILFAIRHRNVPICPDYGCLACKENGELYCTKASRTGCALCGFGIQYDPDRFVRIQDQEPAKIKFAFKPRSEGGLGFRENLEYMNANCGTGIKIPKI